MNRWSPLRLATAVTLAAWASVFWFLLVTGRTTLYLSTRTAWVVPMGAAVLSLAALARLATARSGHRELLSRARAVSLGVVILPAVLVLSLPPTALGSYAASRRAVAGAGIVPEGDISSGQLTLVDVAAAKWSKDAQRQIVRRAGTRVTFVGFVAEEPGGPADE